jgi:4-carboxymuconolactone decarboxylase
MDVSKGAGVFLLAGVVGMLSAGMIQAQNPASRTDSTETLLPKDIYPDSRYRLPLPKRDDMDDDGKKIFDQMTRKSELAVGIEQPGVILWDPQIAKPLEALSQYRKYEIGLPDRLLEIAVLVTAREMDCQYEWTQWETHGRDPKDPRHIEQSTIDIIKYEKPVVGLGEKETAIIAFGRELFGQRKVSSGTFAEVLRLFGRKGTVDLLALMVGYSAAAAELTAFGQQLRADQEPLLPPRVHAQSPVRRADSAEAPLPKDIYPDSRNRLPMPKREDMDDDGKKIFDEVTRVPTDFLPLGTPRPGVILWDPKLAKPMDEAYHCLQYETGLPDQLLEIAVLVTAYELDNQYGWTQWEGFGRNPSDPRHIEQSTIDIIKYNKPTAGLGEKEAAIITLGRELFGQRKVSSETFAEVLRLFGRKGTVDLVEVMVNYSAAAAQLTAFDQQLEEGQKPLLPPRRKQG